MNKNLKKAYDVFPAAFQNWILEGYSALLNRERYGGGFRAYRDLLEKSQWFSRDELIAYQEERLRRLVSHAYETVPYYRKLFDGLKLKPGDIRERGDLVKLPVLTREDIKKNFNALVSTAIPSRKLRGGHTSGTTGSPLEVLYDPAAVSMTYAALDRQYRWAGCQLGRKGDRVTVARGNVIVPLAKARPPFWRTNRAMNQLLLSSFHMSARNLAEYFRAIEQFAPAVLDGYPSTLYILAKYLRNRGRRFPLKAVISSSETLYDFQRSTIEESFQCKVFDYYALAERVVFATECDRHEGHHLCMEYGITEILDGNNSPLPDGRCGKLVGTALANFGMPLIRYQTNDQTALRSVPCSCGRGLDLMDDVTTKAEDILTLKDGRVISPSVLTHPFKPLTSIEESQIVQEKPDWIIVKIVPGRTFSGSDRRHLIEEMRERLGEEVRIDIEIVESCPRLPSGKFKWVVSKVPLGV
ncbi:MAG: phenylacetate--CoA ligase family protein [Deltaproteobacteria bacterium]|nr:MAG: phenylacetate--CoA ligase family protein [Deltaproteobacteria bacterium]